MIAGLLLVGIFIMVFTSYRYVLQVQQGRDYPVGLGDFNTTGQYGIDPNKTLIDLENGKTTILTPIPVLPESSDQLINDETPVVWGFSSYLEVANMVMYQVWSDEINNWSLYRMNFYTNCKDSSNGFSMGDFIFFRPTIGKVKNVYEVREILINPARSRVEWGSDNYFPIPLFGWKKIDLGKVGVSADDAMQIAEDNGGRGARLEVSNVCDIFLSYSPNIKSDNWILTMSHNNDLPYVFEIQINPHSGKFHVVR